MSENVLHEYDSILLTVKHAIGGIGLEEVNHFDPDIIRAINSTFAKLNQLGVGPEETFRIEDDTSTWDEFTDDRNELNLVKDYVIMNVKLLFDPPNSAVINLTKELMAEYEWRMYVLEDNLKN